MHDSDIRQVLKRNLQKLHQAEPDTLVVDELGLHQGATRVDVAVVNGELIGYEIKSDQDTLVRLPTQVDLYSRILDRAVVVVGTNHLDAVSSMVPPWWGINEATYDDGQVTLVQRREPFPNPGVDPHSLVRLLWRAEAIAVLEEVGGAKGLRSKPRQVLWDVLVDSFQLDDLRAIVRGRLKARTNWRSGRKQTLGDG